MYVLYSTSFKSDRSIEQQGGTISPFIDFRNSTSTKCKTWLILCSSTINMSGYLTFLSFYFRQFTEGLKVHNITTLILLQHSKKYEYKIKLLFFISRPQKATRGNLCFDFEFCSNFCAHLLWKEQLFYTFFINSVTQMNRTHVPFRALVLITEGLDES